MKDIRRLTTCKIPDQISAKLRELGREWALDQGRPRIASEVKQAWDVLIQEWVASRLPLIIRKSGIRGAIYSHVSGRDLIVSDNSPAQWAFCQAYAGKVFTLSEIQEILNNDCLPFAFAIKASEKLQMKYKCTLSSLDSVNRCGWKLCHVEDVGLATRIPIGEVPIALLERHFSLLMSPSNQFLIPLQWGGLGEVSEFIGELKSQEATTRLSRNGQAPNQ